MDKTATSSYSRPMMILLGGLTGAGGDRGVSAVCLCVYFRPQAPPY
jgi:hypothetical protein